MSNWAKLPQDVIRLIAQHVKLLEDYIAFTTVCNSWRAVATKENFRGLPLWQRTPCLMLAADKDSNYREFYNLFEDEVVAKVFLPETKGKKCMDVSFGWFFTIGQSGETSLVNPSTRDQIDLPYQYIGDDYRYPWIFYEKALLSSSPCENPTDFVLMVSGLAGGNALYIWRPGDQLWTRVTNCSRQFCDLMYYNNQFYGISWDARVVVFDIEGNNPEESQILAQFPSWFCGEAYIMESLERCIVVIRLGVQVSSASKRPNGYLVYPSDDDSDSDDDPGPYAYGTTTFQVFELDLIDGKWTEIHDLGDRAIFVGHSASVCISQASRSPGIKANCIYFTDDFIHSYLLAENGGGRDMGIYNLEDGNIIPHYKGQSLSIIGPPIWFTPCSNCNFKFK